MPPFGSKRSHHVHVTEPDGEMWRRLAFRDHLRAHPEEAGLTSGSNDDSPPNIRQIARLIPTLNFPTWKV
jgi:hypothetical protein